MTKMTGGELIARMLKAEGVETAFGIVDGSYLALCAGMRRQGIALYTPRHETIGAHMAGAYSRLTGELGVFMASNGPGVANVLSGAAVEAAEGHRVLLLTSCRRTGIHYPNRGGTYQAFDQVGVIGAMAKWSEAVHSADRIAELLRQALRACYSGRPGLVHLDVPENLINGELDASTVLEPRQYRRIEPLVPSSGAVEEAARLLTRAKLPLIHAGGGVVHAAAYEELQAVAELLHAPVTTSWSARGVLDEDHPLAWPMVHVKSNNEARNATDVVLCLGSRLGETDWWGKAPYWATPDKQALIQVDVDEATLGRTRAVDLGVQADVKVFLRQLHQALTGMTQPLDSRRKAVDKLARAQAKERAKLDAKLEDRESPLLSAHLSDICDKLFEPDSVFVFDGGNTTVWGQFFHRAKVPNTVLTTYHMGHLGAGVGQALGAAVARPGRPVCCIIGDGAFGMHPQEVETAVRHELPVIYLVACDCQWGMVKMTQSMAFKPLKMMLRKQLDEGETINADLGEIRYDDLARSMGAHGDRASSPDELISAVKKAIDLGGPAVIHVDVDPTKHLWAPALMHFKAMHSEPKGK